MNKKILITKGYIIETKKFCICGEDAETSHIGSCEIERRDNVWREKQIIKPIQDMVITIDEKTIPYNSKFSTVDEEQL